MPFTLSPVNGPLEPDENVSFAFKEDRNRVSSAPMFARLPPVNALRILLVLLLIASHDIAITFTDDYGNTSLFESCVFDDGTSSYGESRN